MSLTVIAASRAPGPEVAAEIEREIEVLRGLDLQELRVRWRQHLRSVPPPNLSRPLLFRLLAYRIQERVYGELDRETARYLDRVAREAARRRAAGEKRKAKAPPPVPPVALDQRLKPGTLLVREHAGEMHRVTVMAGGFRWGEATYTSLSEVARAITGTRWNGPRFFGLRDRAASEAAP
jgi:hypothetical protein